MEIRLVKNSITKAELHEMAQTQFGSFTKAVVDIERGIMAIGGELHADGEALLLEQGSGQKNLWGINLYPEKPEAEWIVFDAMINVRPSQGNRTRTVENVEIQAKIEQIIQKLVI